MGYGLLIKFLLVAGVLSAIAGYHFVAVHKADKAGYARATAECEARIQKSIDAARSKDAEIAQAAADAAVEQARMEAERTLAAQAQTQEYRDEVSQMEQTLRTCRQPTDRDWQRLQ